MTYEQLIDRIISDGIAEVRAAYVEPEDHHKRDGAIEGFEACRGKKPDELVTLWRAAEDKAHRIMTENYEDPERDVRTYWRARYTALQVEFVINVVSVGLMNNGHPPLLAHLPTARGAMKYAEIVNGVTAGAREDVRR